jgi:hypothetical protein
LKQLDMVKIIGETQNRLKNRSWNINRNQSARRLAASWAMRRDREVWGNVTTPGNMAPTTSELGGDLLPSGRQRYHSGWRASGARQSRGLTPQNKHACLRLREPGNISGHGLGLSIVKRIVEAGRHSGRESERDGQPFCLPRQAEPLIRIEAAQAEWSR